MTKQEIIERCIEAYSEAIEVCKGLELREAKDWLDKKHLDIGVCSYVIERIGRFIYGLDWVIRNNINTMGWHKYPHEATSKKELMKSLTTRLDILKRELEIPE